jgi:ankyrin repeat protein
MTGGEAPTAPIIEHVKAGDHAAAAAALAANAAIGERDDADWSALDWAAGRGDTAAIRMLLEHGADPCATGRELRTPYQIALAAGHLDAARLLRDAEEAADPSSADRHAWRPYCKAFRMADLRRYPGWAQAGPAAELTDDDVVFVHDDLTVTRSMWREEDVVPVDGGDAWARFCRDELGFRVPDDFDLLPDAVSR